MRWCKLYFSLNSHYNSAERRNKVKQDFRKPQCCKHHRRSSPSTWWSNSPPLVQYFIQLNSRTCWFILHYNLEQELKLVYRCLKGRMDERMDERMKLVSRFDVKLSRRFPGDKFFKRLKTARLQLLLVRYFSTTFLKDYQATGLLKDFSATVSLVNYVVITFIVDYIIIDFW